MFPSSLRSSRRIVCLTVCIAAAAVTSLSLAQDEPQAPKQKPIESQMRAKLNASATVLEGLATENSELVSEGSKVLLDLSKAEVWQVLKDSEYREHTQGFRSAVRRMEEAAKEKQFASAQLEWLEATKKCFDCHNHIRKAKK
ncbi:MAG: cytochrome c [Planctomycetaceae bacterium]